MLLERNVMLHHLLRENRLHRKLYESTKIDLTNHLQYTDNLIYFKEDRVNRLRTRRKKKDNSRIAVWYKLLVNSNQKCKFEALRYTWNGIRDFKGAERSCKYKNRYFYCYSLNRRFKNGHKEKPFSLET